jgi:hypothetical protein
VLAPGDIRQYFFKKVERYPKVRAAAALAASPRTPPSHPPVLQPTPSPTPFAPQVYMSREEIAAIKGQGRAGMTLLGFKPVR